MADKAFKGKISVKGTEITILSKGTDDDYISLSDIAKSRTPNFRVMLSKIGCDCEVRLNILVCGSDYTTLISITSNSR